MAYLVRLEVVEIRIEVLTLLRNPNTKAKYLRIIMNVNFDHATNKKVFFVNDAEIGMKPDATLAFFIRHVKPVIRFVHPDIRESFMVFAAD